MRLNCLITSGNLVVIYLTLCGVVVQSMSVGAVSRQGQKERVNGIARRLLARLGARGAALDASYLLAPRAVLAPRRARKALS